MKKSLDDMQYDFGKIFVTAGMAPVLLSPFLPDHPFESTGLFREFSGTYSWNTSAKSLNEIILCDWIRS